MTGDDALTVPPAPEVRFAVLGPVRVWRGGTELRTGPPQQRAMLAVLLASAGQTVPLPTLIALLWGGTEPASATNVVRRYAGSLRRMIEPALPRMAPGQWLVGGGGGYRIEVDADSLDLLRFRELYTRAREARDAGRAGDSVRRYAEALALWRGPVAAGVSAEVRGHPLFTQLDNERLALAVEAADLALRHKDADLVLAPLRMLADQHRFDEQLHAKLLLALAASGRQAEAVDVFHRLRDRLRTELGVSPSPLLSEAHQQVLAGAPPTPPAPEPAPEPAQEPAEIEQQLHQPYHQMYGSPLPRPAQLPAAPAHFVGREAEVDSLLAQLDAGERTAPASPAMVISAIGGMAGVGKTTLAVHLAYRVADRYPDGQLYVNLRGFDLNGSAMTPAEAIRGFLASLGVSPQRIPDGLDAQAALYRSFLADRRMLVLLDNARDTEQVRPLLPGSAGCLVLITSRNQLSSLVAAHGAHPLELDVMSAGSARESLVRRLGADRVDAEPEATETIIALCGRLPLALSVITARALMNPRLPLSATAGQLLEAKGSLDAFQGADRFTDVRAVFGWSYRTLPDDTARLFRLLSLHPGATFDIDSAAALAGLTVRATRPLLAELVRAHLVGVEARGRHRLHDLLRAYGREAAESHDTAEDRDSAHGRLYRHYARTAHAALRLLDPTHLVTVPAGVPAAAAEPSSVEASVEWFQQERLTLTAVVRQAVQDDRPHDAWRLIHLLESMYKRVGPWHDWVDLQHTALAAARQSGEALGLAHAHAGLGRAYSLLRRYESAEEHASHALSLFESLGDRMGQAHCLRILGWLMERTGRDVLAIEHTRRALDLYREAGHLSAQATSLNALAWFQASSGAYEDAVTSAVRSLLVYRRIPEEGDRGHAHTWDTLAFAHHRLGNLRRARLCYERAIRILRANGDRYNEAGSLTRLGDTLAEAGATEDARARWRQALDILTRMDPAWAAEIREKLSATANAP
ncbi:AfsR/SARP family transcriptional regulator [Streptomyces graminilatus]|uniref:AfsR/SARP family transcriptional regulator n=1 Tax=Streptomyces graminilatus TaxID=1464070 RepID=UPI0006E1656E|nr:BTAD domain-containing putative transcriptional regulator [Streptomyces graminilatus]